MWDTITFKRAENGVIITIKWQLKSKRFSTYVVQSDKTEDIIEIVKEIFREVDKEVESGGAES